MLVNRLDITCAQSPDMRTLFYIYLEDLSNADAINYEFSIFESILDFCQEDQIKKNEELSNVFNIKNLFWGVDK